MNVDDKLNALRKLMQERNLSAYIIPTEDFHSSEYVGEYFKVREYMSGFTGSAGTLIVLSDEAALWTDGRYFIQAAKQLAGSSIMLMKAGQPGVPTIAEYLYDKLEEKSAIGFDGRTVTGQFVKTIAKKTDAKQMTFEGGEDLADFVWVDRPAVSEEPVWELGVDYAGKSREEKLSAVREKLKEKKADVLLLTALDEIAWLLNLRGDDVRYTPVFLAYMLVTQDKAVLCIHERILPNEIREKLERAGIDICSYDAVDEILHDISREKCVWIDSRSVNYSLLNSLPAETQKIDKCSPVTLMKAVKTPQEMEHIRRAHIKDGVAVTKFIRWLKMSVDNEGCKDESGEKITEISAAGKLEVFRAQQKGYLGASFEPIIAYGAHGAIVHYEPTRQTDVELKGGSLCLADTGGHYRDGTTDVTRTVALGAVTEEEKRYYTIALRGHLALGAARFRHGVCGQNLDVLAREPLWENGLDYNHGTGHGVGFILSVHEGPQRFQWRISENAASIPLEEGMVISNEPGIYLEGKFGIRHENLVLCRKGEENEHGQFMYLEPLTMVPFDRDAILPELMTDRERQWLNDYHRQVFETLQPYFDGEELQWLQEATAEIF
ncbi:MAG: aminopeptidase P family protein [Lachnospiraceae bacterium]|nr:aminopeptidase P family protein [Lachnospiraceae bacterium]